MLHVNFPKNLLNYEDFLSLYIQKKSPSHYLLTNGYTNCLVSEIIPWIKNNNKEIIKRINDNNCSLIESVKYSIIENSSLPLKITARSYSCCSKRPILSYYLLDGHKRVCAMIGKIIQGESYTPFRKLVL